MPAKRAYGMDQDFYPWSPIVARPVLRWPDGAGVALEPRRRLHRALQALCASYAILAGSKREGYDSG
jgi:hypothetical protein